MSTCLPRGGDPPGNTLAKARRVWGALVRGTPTHCGHLRGARCVRTAVWFWLPSFMHSLAISPLPPTGGEGEAAGVCVGDVVLEVNGQDCREGVAGVPTVMALKMLIQQVKHSSREKAGSWVSESPFPTKCHFL